MPVTRLERFTACALQIDCDGVHPDRDRAAAKLRIDRSLQRIGLGVFEVATFPIPTPDYQPILKKSPTAPDSVYTEKYFSPDPAFPESYKPGLLSDSLFDADTYTGFGGGDIAPWVMGSRFSVFDN